MVNPSDVLDALKAEDRAIFIRLRTMLQGAYLKAHAEVLGFENFVGDDTHFMDALDHKLADLFHRAGRITPLVLPTSSAVRATLGQETRKAVDAFEAVFRPAAKSPAAQIGANVDPEQNAGANVDPKKPEETGTDI